MKSCERASKIAMDLSIEPTTVANYAKASSNKQVNYDAHKAEHQLFDSRNNITAKWTKLIETRPELTPAEKAITIASKINVSPSYVASQVRDSDNKLVKYEASIAFSKLLESKHNITLKWVNLIKMSPTLTPVEKAKAIAKELGIKAITVSGYATRSHDPQVKSEAIKAAAMINDENHQITVKWKYLIVNSPNLTSVERAEKISKKIGIKPITIAGYASKSSDARVKKEANEALTIIAASNYDITGKWRDLILHQLHLEPWEKAKLISKKLNIQPSTVARYARSSNDPRVKSEANSAYGRLMTEKHSLTERWLHLIQTRQDLSSSQKVSILSKDIGLRTLSVCSYGFHSSSRIVKKEANKAYNNIMIEKYDLTNKWKEITKINPSLTPIQKAEEISKIVQISSVSVAGYTRVSPDKKVRVEAISALNEILIKHHNIEEQWLKLKKSHPELVPHEKAQKIAHDLEINPITLSSYAMYSNNKIVKNEANISYNVLREMRRDITNRWKSLMLGSPTLTPKEISNKIAKEQKIKPITIAGYGRSSFDKEVKSQAMKAYSELLSEK
jgi:L-ribulose-5-phosphate 3-epimerase UlaE